jgi:hypothetical protein
LLVYFQALETKLKPKDNGEGPLILAATTTEGGMDWVDCHAIYSMSIEYRVIQQAGQ